MTINILKWLKYIDVKVCIQVKKEKNKDHWGLSFRLWQFWVCENDFLFSPSEFGCVKASHMSHASWSRPYCFWACHRFGHLSAACACCTANLRSWVSLQVSNLWFIDYLIFHVHLSLFFFDYLRIQGILQVHACGLDGGAVL